MRMKPSLLVFGLALIVITIGSRAIPLRSTIDHPGRFWPLSILSLGASVAVYRLYRKELLRIGRSQSEFALMMGFIACVLLIQLSVRIGQL
jgi:hypothetical protein